MKVFTIGYTQKTAEQFFTILRNPDILRVVDIRLSNNSLYAGYTKKDSLEYFLREICNIDYLHRLDLAPTKELFADYKSTHDWPTYEAGLIQLFHQRDIVNTFPEDLLDGSCYLCAEPTADQCHRRLVVECLKNRWADLEIVHL
jgi:uncharacterized protein (DUF488 family)